MHNNNGPEDEAGIFLGPRAELAKARNANIATLRDRFAMAALPQIIRDTAKHNTLSPDTLAMIAGEAYSMANAMLAARSGEQAPAYSANYAETIEKDATRFAAEADRLLAANHLLRAVLARLEGELAGCREVNQSLAKRNSELDQKIEGNRKAADNWRSSYEGICGDLARAQSERDATKKALEYWKAEAESRRAEYEALIATYGGAQRLATAEEWGEYKKAAESRIEYLEQQNKAANARAYKAEREIARIEHSVAPTSEEKALRDAAPEMLCLLKVVAQETSREPWQTTSLTERSIKDLLIKLNQ